MPHVSRALRGQCVPRARFFFRKKLKRAQSKYSNYLLPKISFNVHEYAMFAVAERRQIWVKEIVPPLFI